MYIFLLLCLHELPSPGEIFNLILLIPPNIYMRVILSRRKRRGCSEVIKYARIKPTNARDGFRGTIFANHICRVVYLPKPHVIV